MLGVLAHLRGGAHAFNRQLLHVPKVSIRPSPPQHPCPGQCSTLAQCFKPDPLRDKRKVHEAVVRPNNDLPCRLSSQEGAKEICQVTQAPFDKESDAQTGRGLEPVVLDDLGQLGEEPG